MTEEAHFASWLAIFQEESLQGLDDLAVALSQPSPSAQQRDDMYRVLHTLRGSAAMQGFDDLSAWACQLETLFDEVRSGERELSDELRGLASLCLAGLRALVESPGQPLSAALLAGLLDLQRWAGFEANVVSQVLGAQVKSATDAQGLFWIDFAPGPDLMRRGVDVLALLGELDGLGQLACVADVSDLPDLSAMEPDRVYLRWRMVLITQVSQEEIQDIFMFVDADSHLNVVCLLPYAALPLALQQDLQDLLQKSPDCEAFLSALRQADSDAQAEPEPRSVAPLGQTHIMVPAADLDQQMDLLGELVMAQSTLSQAAMASSDVQLRMAVDQIGRLTTDLRSNVMALRKVPAGRVIDQLFADVQARAQQRFGRAECAAQGQDIALDVSVLNELQTHLHAWLSGVMASYSPSSEETAEGLHVNLNLSLVQQQVHWRFEIDGLSQCLSEPLELCRAVQTLGGTCEQESTSDHGGVVVLRLPLAQGIIDGLLVTSQGQHFVLPMNLVEEVVDLQTTWSRVQTRQDVLDIRGGAVPFVRLAPFLGLESDTMHAMQGHVLIVTNQQTRLGILVDKVLGQQQTVIKRVNLLGQHSPYLFGATLLPDGKVAMVLDVLAILQEEIQT